jgi:hypothetical protein
MSINDATNRIRLFTVDGPIPVTGGGSGTEYTEGDAHVPPAMGNAVLGVVDISSPSLTDQTYTTLRFDAAGNLRTTGSGPGTVNVIQLGGNPINTGAGPTASGTQRVVIANDQTVPVSGTVAVTGTVDTNIISTITLPENLVQLGGTTITAGIGASTAATVAGNGTQRVVIASDQPVIPVSVASFPTLQNVNLTQVAGNTVQQGSVASTTLGVQGVALASDQLPAAVTLTDSLANTVPRSIVGAANLVFNDGGTWTRVSAGNGATTSGTTRVTLTTDQARARDSVAGANDRGLMALTVRKDVAGSLVDTDGDYTPLQVTATGSLRVAVASGPTGTEYISGDAVGVTTQGPATVAIRKDANGALTGVADGDYSALQVDVDGRLKAGTEYTDASTPVSVQGGAAMAIAGADAAVGAGTARALRVTTTTNRLAVDATVSSSTNDYTSGNVVGASTLGPATIAIRKDANGPLTGVADGDYSAFQVDSNGRLKTGTEYVTATIPSGAVQGGAVIAPSAADAAATVGTAYSLHLAPATGRLAVDALVSSSATDYVSGSAAANPPVSAGPQVVAVYKAGADGLFSNVADGDFTALQVDSGGRLKAGTEYVESTVPTPTTQGPLAMAMVAGAGITATLKMDAATDRLNTRDVSTFQWNQGSSNGGDYGMAASAVRTNYPQPLANQNNVYSPLQTDWQGSLRTADPRLHVDPYGRQTVASPFVTGDYRFQHDPFPTTDPTWAAEFWSRYSTVTWDSDRLWVVVGSGAWLQTKAAHPYYSGKAQRIEFCVNNMLNSGSRCGYFHQTKLSSSPDTGGSMDGMWLDTFEGNVRFRIMRNGDSIYDVEQNSWNVDTLNGSGDPNTNPSGVTVDFTRTLVATFEFLYAENIVYLYISQNVPGAAITNGPRYLANVARVTTEMTEFLMISCPNQPVTFLSQNGELRVFWAQVSSLGVTPAEMPGIPRNVSNTARIRGLASGRFYALCGVKLGDSSVAHPIRTNCLYPSFLSITAQPADNDPARSSPFTWWLIINPLQDGTLDTPFTASLGSGWVSGNTPLGTATYQTYTQNDAERCAFTADSILYTGTGFSSVTQQWNVPPLRRIGTSVDTSQSTSQYWDELWVVVEPTYPNASLDVTASITMAEIF